MMNVAKEKLRATFLDLNHYLALRGMRRRQP